MQRRAVGAETENATSVKTEGCAYKKLVAGVGFEPSKNHGEKHTQPIQNLANSKHDSALPSGVNQAAEHNRALTVHRNDTTERPECVPDVYQNFPEDLAQIVEAWANLPEQDQASILAIVRKAGEK